MYYLRDVFLMNLFICKLCMYYKQFHIYCYIFLIIMPVFTFLLTVLTIIIMDVLKLTNFFLVKSNPY